MNSTDEKAIRDLREDVISLRDENRRLRADLDVLRSGRLGVVGWKGSSGLVRDNGIITRLIKDAAVTDDKIDSLSVGKLLAGDIEVEFNITTGSLLWGDETGRLSNEGIQLETADGSKVRAVSWVDALPALGEDVDGLLGAQIWGSVTDAGNSAALYLDALPALGFSASTPYVQMRLQNQVAPNWYITAANAGGAEAYLAGLAQNGWATGVIDVVGSLLRLATSTSDYTDGVSDGALLYRSDTDKFRARVNGAWVNLLTSADSVGLQLAFQSGAIDAAPVPGQLFIYTGTGGNTYTLTNYTSDSFGGVKNLGTGNLTVVVASSGLIDGASSLTLAPYDSALFFGYGGNTVVII